MAAIVALGAVSGFGQNPCEDAPGMAALDAKFRENYGKKEIALRKSAVDAGKQYIDKYGACPDSKDFVEYLQKFLPGMETKIAADEKQIAKDALYNRFNNSVKTSTFDETYASGREILAKEPDQLDVIISLGSIGYDESYKGNFKYNDDTLKFAKQAIAALEAGKTSSTFGLYQWSYKNKDNALGWLNYTIGYIYQVAQKNKKEALPYLYKATQANSDTKKNPIPYELIGAYYFDELNKITAEITEAAKGQNPTDTEEVAKQKVEAIKAKVALANGTAERAMDAFARAYTLAAPTPAAKPYKDKMYKNLQDAYKLRFAKTEGLDAWIAGSVAKPMPSPLTAVTPIFDPEPVTTTTSTAPAPTAAPTTAKPAGTTTVKPVAPVVKPGTPVNGKPVTSVKPQAKVKKPIVKRKVV